MESTIERAALSLADACKYLGTSRPTLYRLMDGGEIPSFHIGRKRLVLREHLDEFIKERLAAAGTGGERGQGS